METNLQDLLQQFESREGEKIQHVLIGSPDAIYAVKTTLHRLRYAEIGLWSAVIPIPGTTLSMSVLTRHQVVYD